MTIWGREDLRLYFVCFKQMERTLGQRKCAFKFKHLDLVGYINRHFRTCSGLFFCHITSCDCRGKNQKKNIRFSKKLRDPKKTHWKSPNSHLRLNRVPEKMEIHPRCHNQANLTCNSLGGLGLRMPGQKGCGFVLANPLQRLFLLKSNQPYSANPFNCNQHFFCKLACLEALLGWKVRPWV